MPDDTWVPNREKLDTLTAEDPKASEMAEHFKLLADVLDGVTLEDGSRCSENVALLLSTCRNAFLTVNAVFEDFRRMFGHGVDLSPLASAVEGLASGDTQKARESLNEVKALLDEAGSKLHVWQNRREYNAAFDRYLNSSQFDLLQRGRVKGLLNEVKVPDASEEGHWREEYFRIDLGEKPRLFTHFEQVIRTQKATESITRLLHYLLVMLEARVAEGKVAQSYLPFEGFTETHSPSPDEAWNKVRDLLADAGALLNLQVADTGRGVTRIQYEREAGRPILLQLSSEGASPDQLAAVLEIIGCEIQRLYSALLNGPFRPNVGTPPLPKPYILDLRPQEPDPSLELVPVIARPISCSDALNEPEQIRIALFDGGIGGDSFNMEKLRYKDDARRSEVKDFISNAIRMAAKADAMATVFPECCVPESACEDLHATCCSVGHVLIGGVESSWTRDGKRHNQAVVCIPGEEQPRFQCKQRPSAYETRIEDFHTDGIINVFYNTPLGCFAVLVCSDMLELDVVSALSCSPKMPEVVFVCTMNPYPSLFRSLITADAYRLYSYVAKVNNRDLSDASEREVPGAIVAAPLNPKASILEAKDTIPLANGKVPSFYKPCLKVFDLDLSAIRRRSHEKPAPAFSQAPHFRRHV